MVEQVKKSSFRGKIARASISIFTNIPSFFGDVGLMRSAKVAKKLHLWRSPKGYKLKKYNINDLVFEVLEKEKGLKDKVIVQFHGGCYYIGYNDVHRKIALRYSQESKGAKVVSLDYRKAPEHAFPAALEDALKLWDWLLKKGYKEENIIIVGDSAGGNLALALGLKLRDDKRKLPKAFVLMSPWTDMTRSGNSYRTNILKDPMFGGKKTNSFKLLWAYAGEHDLYDKYLSPVYGEYHDFPTMLIQVGTHELLESDSETVYEKANKANVDVTLTKYEGMFHVFQVAGNIIPESRLAWKQIEGFIQNQFNN